MNSVLFGWLAALVAIAGLVWLYTVWRRRRVPPRDTRGSERDAAIGCLFTLGSVLVVAVMFFAVLYMLVQFVKWAWQHDLW
jgi:hypothetical protein